MLHQAGTRVYGAWAGAGLLISLAGQLTKSVAHDQCDAGPTVTFSAAGHHCHLARTKLHCLVIYRVVTQ